MTLDAAGDPQLKTWRFCLISAEHPGSWGFHAHVLRAAESNNTGVMCISPAHYIYKSFSKLSKSWLGWFSKGQSITDLTPYMRPFASKFMPSSVQPELLAYYLDEGHVVFHEWNAKSKSVNVANQSSVQGVMDMLLSVGRVVKKPTLWLVVVEGLSSEEIHGLHRIMDLLDQPGFETHRLMLIYSEHSGYRQSDSGAATVGSSGASAQHNLASSPASAPLSSLMSSMSDPLRKGGDQSARMQESALKALQERHRLLSRFDAIWAGKNAHFICGTDVNPLELHQNFNRHSKEGVGEGIGSAEVHLFKQLVIQEFKKLRFAKGFPEALKEALTNFHELQTTLQQHEGFWWDQTIEQEGFWWDKSMKALLTPQDLPQHSAVESTSEDKAKHPVNEGKVCSLAILKGITIHLSDFGSPLPPMEPQIALASYEKHYLTEELGDALIALNQQKARKDSASLSGSGSEGAVKRL